MTRDGSGVEQSLYIWLDRDPLAFEPELAIEDVPGVADIDLLTSAILEGRLGDVLPARISMSTHREPRGSGAVRNIDVGRLLRDLGIVHRRCYRIELPHEIS
jgi:hypothetical protein